MYAAIGGLVVLVAGMIASLQAQYLFLSLGALALGFFLSQFGSYNLRRWSRNPRPDQVVEEALKGFDDRWHLYSWTLPAPLVLLSPQGIYTIETRDQTGQINVKGNQWRTKFSLGRTLLLFGQEGIGNPTRDAQNSAAKVEKVLTDKVAGGDVKAQPVIVFIDKRVQLNLEEPDIPVLDADGLKKWLRGPGKGEYFRSADMKAIEQALDAQSAEAGGEEVERKRKRK